MNLKAGIRTTEFWLVVAADVALAAVSLLHGGLSPQHAVQYGSELNGVYVIARTVPKGLATLNGIFGVGAVDTGKADATAGKIETEAESVIPVVQSVVEGFKAPESAAKPDPEPAPTPEPVAVTSTPTAVPAGVDPLAPVHTA